MPRALWWLWGGADASASSLLSITCVVYTGGSISYARGNPVHGGRCFLCARSSLFLMLEASSARGFLRARFLMCEGKREGRPVAGATSLLSITCTGNLAYKNPVYRGTSRISNSPPLGPYRCPDAGASSLLSTTCSVYAVSYARGNPVACNLA